MLRIFHSMESISFASLLDIYSHSLYKEAENMNGADAAENRLRAEQDFYSYLSESFFQTPSAFYALWEHEARYVAALRMEPYRDGLLLEGLETSPNARGRGYATNLLLQTLSYLSNLGRITIYAHVDKKNKASLRVHEKAGFSVISESASFIDGSFSSSSYTLCKILG